MEVARARGPLVLLGAHLAGVNAAFSQELVVGHSEGLANGLSNELGLWWMGSVSLGVSCPPLPRPPNPLTNLGPSLPALPGTRFPGDSLGSFQENSFCLGDYIGNGRTDKPGAGKVSGVSLGAASLMYKLEDA